MKIVFFKAKIHPLSALKKKKKCYKDTETKEQNQQALNILFPEVRKQKDKFTNQ